MKFEYQDKIDKYVRGEMSSDECKEFETELQENKELRDQKTYTEKVKKLVSSREQKMTMLRAWEEEDEREGQKVAAASYRPTGTGDFSPAKTAMPASAYAEKPKKRIWYWISGIAAILVVGFFVVSPMFNKEDVLRSPGNSPGNSNVRGDEEVFESAPTSVNDTTSVDTIMSNRE